MNIVRLMVGLWKDNDKKTYIEEEMWRLNPGTRHRGWMGRRAHSAQQHLRLREASVCAPWGEHDTTWADQTKTRGHSHSTDLHGAPVIITLTLEHRYWSPLLCFQSKKSLLTGSIHKQRDHLKLVSDNAMFARVYVFTGSVMCPIKK